MPRTHVAARAPLLVILAAIALVTAMLTPISVQASSHREAPMISRDPTADNTDLYAFRSPDGSNTVTLVANFIPLEEPAGGPNFNAFDDNVLYELKVDNTGDARADVTYQFRFKTTYVDSDLFGPSFLFNDFVLESINDADLLVRQTYTVRRVVGDTSTLLGSGWSRQPTSVRARPRATRPTSAPAAGSTCRTGARPSPARATIRSSSTWARSSTWAACGRSTRRTSQRFRPHRASTGWAATTPMPSR